MKDTTTASFRADVLDASMQVPVIVDFWAPWCGPCKQLGPIIEKAVKDARGAVKLVKINVDENQELAAQMRIQSIPAVYAFFQGRPVDGFVGAQPESALKQFIQKLAKLGAGEAGPSPIDEALEHAEAALKEGDHEAASAIFAQILEHEPDNLKAIGGMVRCCIAVGELDQAKHFLAQVPAAQANDPAIAGARGADRAGGGGPEGGRPVAGAARPGRCQPEGFRGALRPGAGFVRRRRPRGRRRPAAGDHPHEPRLERGGGAQGAGEVLRGDGPDRSADLERAAAPVLDPVQLGVRMRPGPTSLGPFDPGYRALPDGAADLSADRGRAAVGRAPAAQHLRAALSRDDAPCPAAADAPHRHGAAGGDKADRDPDPAARPAVQRIGCAGRIVSFQETEEGRYLITLSGLIRFAIKRELPLHEGGFRLVEPDFAPFAEDMAERDFEMAAKAEFLAAFKAYIETKQLKVDWDAIKGAPDDHLLVSLAMLSPFSPEEKQSLLECADLAQLTAMMTALFELAVANRQSPRSHSALREFAMTDLTPSDRTPAFAVDPKLLEILVCPLTKGTLIYDREKQELVSRGAGLAYPIRDGIPIMLVDEARQLDDDD